MNDEILDWSKLPVELKYLASPAEKYGSFQFDDRIQEFLYYAMTSSDIEQLRLLRDRMAENYIIIEKWLDTYNMQHHPEARLVYFMRCLIGTADDAYLL